jgi:hypothetical protein
MFRQFLMAVTLSIIGLTASAQDPKTYYNIPDDGYAIVPIPFGFPFYGRLFTHSIMFDNGVVSFYDPTTESARLGGQQFNAFPLSNNIGSNFHYSIMPLWTDLVGNANSKFYTQTDSSTYLKYSWQDVQQWGYANRLNSFSLQIKPTGFFGVTYDKVNIAGYPVTAGHVGDASAGEWSQIYHQPSGEATTLSNLQSWSVGSTGAALDCSSSLNDPACPGYSDAYYIQQCSISALYDPACPGYTSAYLDQQCSISSLHSPFCPGYAAAYLEQQCSLDPLYSTTCDGYEAAYLEQQCSLDPLYNTQCVGYADARYVQQCTADPLFDSGCTGYETAYFNQQCSLNTLYNNQCPGYETAYFNQQCSLDPLYNTQCVGYAEAYAKKNIFVTKVEPEQEAVKVSVVTPIEVAQVVIVEQQTQSASASPADVTAAVQLVTPAPTPAAVSPATTTAKAEPTNATSPSASSSTTTASVASSAEKKDAPKTTRQALAERRLEAARKKAVDQGAKVADQMNSATTMEQQVEAQGVILSAMGFVPGFDAYGKSFIPDGAGYKPFTIYNNQTNVDNARMMRGLSGASDRLHEQMIDSQYNRSLP